MLVDNDRAAQLDLWTRGFVTSNPVCLGVQDLLADRDTIFAVFLAEAGELTERQAADRLGLDRLDFRRAAEYVRDLAMRRFPANPPMHFNP